MAWRYVLLVVSLILSVGCLTSGPVQESGTPVTSPTLAPPVTTSSEKVMVDESRIVPRNAQKNWELTIDADRRIAVEVRTDGAPVDLVVLDAYNYDQKFSLWFSSKSGTMWDEVVALEKNIVTDRVGFKTVKSGKYRVIIENADMIPGGAVTTRDVNVQVRVLALD